ncbi:MAG TPA: antibiotic biosynthesis monooxygenase [Rhodocyclaceae bacterium]|nr:antibiotic biosynthesis monooxygenase [Rhodocyclaceae bacterium]
MVIVIFRSRIRPDADAAVMASAGAHMYELASAMPGFISYKDFVAEDGEYASIVEFADAASLKAWREHPEHRLMQQRGREEFMSEYHIQVCEPIRNYSFKAD